MFPVDALHTLIRHSTAHHRRETIAFGRRINALMERTFLFVVWRNFVKWRSERKPDPTSPAMRIGLTDSCWDWPQVFSRRLFPAREDVPDIWRTLYRRDWISPRGPGLPSRAGTARSGSGARPGPRRRPSPPGVLRHRGRYDRLDPPATRPRHPRRDDWGIEAERLESPPESREPGTRLMGAFAGSTGHV